MDIYVYNLYFLIIGNMNITHMFIWNLIYGYLAINYFSHSCDQHCHSFWFNGPCFLNFNYFLEEKKSLNNNTHPTLFTEISGTL